MIQELFTCGNRFITPDRAQHSHLHAERASVFFFFFVLKTMPRPLYHSMSQLFFSTSLTEFFCMKNGLFAQLVFFLTQLEGARGRSVGLLDPERASWFSRRLRFYAQSPALAGDVNPKDTCGLSFSAGAIIIKKMRWEIQRISTERCTILSARHAQTILNPLRKKMKQPEGCLRYVVKLV